MILPISYVRFSRVLCKTLCSINPPILTIPLMDTSPIGGNSFFTAFPGKRDQVEK